MSMKEAMLGSGMRSALGEEAAKIVRPSGDDCLAAAAGARSGSLGGAQHCMASAVCGSCKGRRPKKMSYGGELLSYCRDVLRRCGHPAAARAMQAAAFACKRRCSTYRYV